MTNWLEPTTIADYGHPSIQRLIDTRRWRDLSPYARVGAAYDFVRDEVRFGYNASDDLPASGVLAEGLGQCNTKGNLLVALLRGLGLSTRFHGFTIDKALQVGAIPRWLHPVAPRRILHSWVEVSWEGRWIALEGFILDRAYLQALQARFPRAVGFTGYGVATLDLRDPPVRWRGEPTYIQKEGIVDDFGVFDHPDDLYRRHGTNLSGARRVLFQQVFRHAMNRTVARIRATKDESATDSGPTRSVG